MMEVVVLVVFQVLVLFMGSKGISGGLVLIALGFIMEVVVEENVVVLVEVQMGVIVGVKA